MLKIRILCLGFGLRLLPSLAIIDIILGKSILFCVKGDLMGWKTLITVIAFPLSQKVKGINRMSLRSILCLQGILVAASFTPTPVGLARQYGRFL